MVGTLGFMTNKTTVKRKKTTIERMFDRQIKRIERLRYF